MNNWTINNPLISLWLTFCHPCSFLRCFSWFLTWIKFFERQFERYFARMGSLMIFCADYISRKRKIQWNLRKMICAKINPLTGALSGLRQFLATESPLKMIKMLFILPWTLFSFFRYFHFCSGFLFDRKA